MAQTKHHRWHVDVEFLMVVITAVFAVAMLLGNAVLLALQSKGGKP